MLICYFSAHNLVAIFNIVTENSSKYHVLYRGSYMSAQVLLDLLNELGKSDKMRGLPSIFFALSYINSIIHRTEVRMLESIHHSTLKLLKIGFLA